MGGKWISGENETFKWQIKQFAEGSNYGVDKGRISVLWIQRKSNMEIAANYDRGWDVQVTSEAKPLYDLIISKYN